MATFYSKYRSYGISIPGKAKIKFKEHLYETDNPDEIKALRESPQYKTDFNEVKSEEKKK